MKPKGDFLKKLCKLKNLYLAKQIYKKGQDINYHVRNGNVNITTTPTNIKRKTMEQTT